MIKFLILFLFTLNTYASNITKIDKEECLIYAEFIKHVYNNSKIKTQKQQEDEFINFLNKIQNGKDFVKFFEYIDYTYRFIPFDITENFYYNCRTAKIKEF